jgi:hypothetical protein
VAIGGRLWVRENCRAWEAESNGDGMVQYMADETSHLVENTEEAADRWGEMYHYGKSGPKDRVGQTVPAIHMPRWASRLTLEVTDVRVQRLDDISSDDAEAEGLLCGETEGGDLVWSGTCQTYPIPAEQCHESADEAFAELWDSINGPDAWNSNPWVAAYTFTVHRNNIDEVSA